MVCIYNALYEPGMQGNQSVQPQNAVLPDVRIQNGGPASLIETAPVIDAMPEADPQEMARQLWRDAKKDPPDPNVDVIVYCSDGAILTAFMYDNGDWAENRERIPLDDVTHWMPNITGPELEEPEA